MDFTFTKIWKFIWTKCPSTSLIGERDSVPGRSLKLFGLGTRKPTAENLKVAWTKFSTLSQNVFIMSVIALHIQAWTRFSQVWVEFSTLSQAVLLKHRIYILYMQPVLQLKTWPWANIIKLLTAHKLRMFDHGRPFQPSLMFASKEQYLPLQLITNIHKLRTQKAL